MSAAIDAVVIGASAGGVDALLELLPTLPADYATPILVVLHLPRERPSLLVDIFTPKCAIDVREAEDKEPLAPATVYFAPPDYHLLVDRGPLLALSTDSPVNWSRPSIDVLFESAADVFRSRLAAIVLTGANDDGAAGLAAVHRAGGVTVVQDPAGASSSQMPASALRQITPDHILSLEAIASMLRTWTRPASTTSPA